MSTHPNAILLLTLTPDGLTRKTYRAIMSELGVAEDDDSPYPKISGKSYHVAIMEESYIEDTQIAAKVGDIVFYDLVTYGYGEVVKWEDLERQKADLEAWARGICERHQCTAAFFVTANYW